MMEEVKHEYIQFNGDPTGYQFWSIKDKAGWLTHRLDGPARVWKNNSTYEEWYNYGKIHRVDGPAVVGRRNQYWINGIDITDDVEKWIEDNNFPKWPNWDDEIKTLFKLTFA